MTWSRVMKQVTVSLPMAVSSGFVVWPSPWRRSSGAGYDRPPRSWRVAGHDEDRVQAPGGDADLPQVSVIPSSAKAGDSALEALVDAAAGILSAASLPGTLGRIAHPLATLDPHDDR